MKVLHQIISYLRGRGVLTQEQLAEFASQGILRWEEVYGEPPEPEAPPPEPPVRAEEEIEEPALRRPGRVRRGGRSVRVSVIEPEELCRRLRERFGNWRSRLQGLVALDTQAEDWEQAVMRIRNASADDLFAALAAGLRGQSLTLGALWEALQLEDYRDIGTGPDGHGPTAFAYRALLRVPDLAGLGRYAVLLREPEVAAVVNLMHAQRRLLQSCAALLQRQPELVAAALRREAAAPAYWAFVLLYASRRGVPGQRPWPATEEQPPLHAPPGEEDWPRLWSQAVAMDRPAVTPFLIERTRLQDERPRALAEALAGRISALEDKPRTMLFHYFRQAWPLDRAAAQVGISEAQAMDLLQAFSHDLRKALSGHPATRVFLQPAAARCLDAFLADCLGSTWGEADYGFNRDREDLYSQAIRTYYGPAFDLLCPRSWN